MRQASRHFQVLADDAEINRDARDEWSRQADACRLCAERIEAATGAMGSARGA